MIDALALNLDRAGMEGALTTSGAALSDAFGMALTDALNQSLEQAAETAGDARSGAAG